MKGRPGIPAAMLLTVALAATSAAAQAQTGAPQAAPAQQAQSSQPQAAQQPAAAQALTFAGDVALWTVAIKPDKTAAFEQIMARVRDGLTKSDLAQRREQAASWKVMRLDTPLPDGNIAYVHVISPVVHGADYSVMQILYEAFPAERQSLYELYRSAFAQNLSLATGPVAVDLSKGAAAPALAAR
jgi:hypothetical protein